MLCSSFVVARFRRALCCLPLLRLSFSGCDGRAAFQTLMLIRPLADDRRRLLLVRVSSRTGRLSKRRSPFRRSTTGAALVSSLTTKTLTGRPACAGRGAVGGGRPCSDGDRSLAKLARLATGSVFLSSSTTRPRFVAGGIASAGIFILILQFDLGHGAAGARSGTRQGRFVTVPRSGADRPRSAVLFGARLYQGSVEIGPAKRASEAVGGGEPGKPPFGRVRWRMPRGGPTITLYWRE